MNQYRIYTQTIKIRYRYTLTCEDGLGIGPGQSVLNFSHRLTYIYSGGGGLIQNLSSLLFPCCQSSLTWDGSLDVTKAQCNSRCHGVKDPSFLNGRIHVGEEHRPYFGSFTPVTMTFPYEGNILERARRKTRDNERKLHIANVSRVWHPPPLTKDVCGAKTYIKVAVFLVVLTST